MDAGRPHFPSSPVSRRAILHGVAGTLALGKQAAAQTQAGPPPFFTTRQQFRIVRPARQVGDTVIQRLDGSSTSLGRFRGKVILLNFWATWCPACKDELPLLEKAQRVARPNDLQVIAISVDRGDRSIVERYARNLGIKHLVLGHDPDGAIAHSRGSANPEAPFALYGMPISYVLNRAGGIEGYMLGEADWLSEPAQRLLDHFKAI